MSKPKRVPQPKQSVKQVNAHNRMIARDLLAQVETLVDAPLSKRSSIARRMLKNIHKLLPSASVSGDALAADFEDSSYVITSEPEINIDGDMIYIHGHFSLKELAERIVW